MSSYTYRDENLVEVPDTVITESCEVRESVENTLINRPGAHVTARATISGSVLVEKEGAHSPVDGTVSIQAGGVRYFTTR